MTAKILELHPSFTKTEAQAAPLKTDAETLGKLVKIFALGPATSTAVCDFLNDIYAQLTSKERRRFLKFIREAAPWSMEGERDVIYRTGEDQVARRGKRFVVQPRFIPMAFEIVTGRA